MRRTLARSSLFALGLLAGAARGPAHATPDLTVTVDVMGDTAPIATDGSDLFSADGNIPSATGAFPYDLKFTYDFSQVNGSVLPNLVGYTGPTDATFTALGHTFSISDPNGSLTLSIAPGDNFYDQKVSDGTTRLDVFAAPEPISSNPINAPALAQNFSFAAQPFSSPSPSEANTRIIFADGDTNILANVNTVTYSAGISCASIVNGGITTSLSGSSNDGKPTEIHASFMPNFGLSLGQAASDCGFSAFDWKQTITAFPTMSSTSVLVLTALTPNRCRVGMYRLAILHYTATSAATWHHLTTGPHLIVVLRFLFIMIPQL